MQEIFNHSEVDRAAQDSWQKSDAYRVTANSSKPKYYACSMLPYPSGNLHMGHVRNYTINDMLTRHLRMQGYNVLMPMGWDAFGLPAENAALKHKVPPAKWTLQNISYMKSQMQAMGLAIDWSREISTCDAEYYRWTQWLFLKMLEKGIAYRKTQVVNWDPVDQTVLANEQVIDGRGWRTGALVEKKEIPGYYLKITDYANELLEQVQNNLPQWPERVRLMQENWIGKSQGLRFAFTHNISDTNGNLINGGKMYVFTTRPDTIMGVTYCAVAPQHPLAQQAAQDNPQLQQFIAECQIGDNTEAALATKEKLGMATGLEVIHPLTGKAIPLWVANYVLMNYGDGAVMAVPAHDERDFEFANKYNLPIRQVIQVEQLTFNPQIWQDWYADKQGITINSAEFDGLTFNQAVDKISNVISTKGLGEKTTTWRLRDWGISRQRYWGTPIPIIHCTDCGPQPVPEQDLPVVLPTDLVPDGSGNPLETSEAFHAGVTCPVCGKDARRETDTMDTFVDSSWYYLRYCDPHNNEQIIGDVANYWMPMDQYIGGIEHAILHLLYARFWVKVMRDLGLVNFDEPFKKLLTQGMVLNHTFLRRDEKGGIQYFWPHEVEILRDETGKITAAKLKQDGSLVEYAGIGTMSKSKNNGVDPKNLIEQYGADTVRLYTMFTAPPEATLEWNDSAVDGSYRFLRRLWNLAYKVTQNIDTNKIAQLANQTDYTGLTTAGKKLRLESHKILQQINFDYQRMQYNTVVSGAMKMLNNLENFNLDNQQDQLAIVDTLSILLRVIYPVTPHICYQLWQQLGLSNQLGDLLDTSWPQVDQTALQQSELQLVLQINGKTRGNIVIDANASQEQIEQLVKQHPITLKFLTQGNIKKIIIVPKRLINVVIN